MLMVMLSDCSVSDVPNHADCWISSAHWHHPLPSQKVPIHSLQLQQHPQSQVGGEPNSQPSTHLPPKVAQHLSFKSTYFCEGRTPSEIEPTLTMPSSRFLLAKSGTSRVAVDVSNLPMAHSKPAFRFAQLSFNLFFPSRPLYIYTYIQNLSYISFSEV